MCQEAQRPEPVVEGHHHDAICCEFGAVVVQRAVFGKATPVDPHEHRPPGAATQRRRGDVQVQAVLGLRAGGCGRLGPCGQLAAYCDASRMPRQDAGRWGARHRRSPTGGAA